MTMVVGLPRDKRSRATLHLAAMLARSATDDLVVTTVLPQPWPAGVARIDAEYQEYLNRVGHEALDRAREELPADVPADFVLSRARSTPTGLLELVTARDAGVLVLGSSTAGVLGRVAFGSVAERLLHSSPVPVAIAPRGFRCRSDAVVTRVTAAFGATDGADELVVAAAGVAARVGGTLRVASFAVRPRTPLTAGVGSRAEVAVVQEWERDVGQAQRAALARVARLPHVPPALDAVVGHGADWAGALEDVGWAGGDVLVVGSSAVGPVARVFLGSRSSKIVRHSPVPVLVLPRGAAADLAGRAARPD